MRHSLPVVSCAVLLLVLLSGCAKATVTVDVRPDHTVHLGAAIGLSQEVKSLTTAQDGSNIFSYMTTDEWEGWPGISDVKLRTWTEGGYEWKELSGVFPDIAQFNACVRDKMPLLKNVSVSAIRGVQTDRFQFQGFIEPEALWSDLSPSSGTTLSQDSPLDIRQAIDVQIVVKLPGQIVATSGTYQGQSADTVVWRIAGKQTITMTATSEYKHRIDIPFLVEQLSQQCGVRSAGISTIVVSLFLVLRRLFLS